VILAQIDNRPERAFAERPEDRIAAILTAADDRFREDVLNSLRDSEPELTQRVEQAIFTFDLIPTRIAANDIPKALKTADIGDLTRAMAYAQSNGRREITEFILENLPKRLRATSKKSCMRSTLYLKNRAAPHRPAWLDPFKIKSHQATLA
jgi:flagellar motor switch protein FliG